MFQVLFRCAPYCSASPRVKFQVVKITTCSLLLPSAFCWSFKNSDFISITSNVQLSTSSSPDSNGKQNAVGNFSFFRIKLRPAEAVFILLKTVFHCIFLEWIAGLASYSIVWSRESISDKWKKPNGKLSTLFWLTIFPRKVAGGVANGFPPLLPAILKSLFM